MGKVSMISDAKTGRMTTIMWSQKKVFEMNPEDLEDMKAEADAAVKMALENLPPEMREQMEAEMAKEKIRSDSDYSVTATGKTSNLNGFSCEEYRVIQDEEVMSVWAAADDIGIGKTVDRISKRFDALFQDDEDDGVDEWLVVPGKIPIEVRRYVYSMMGDPVLEIQSIQRIEKRKPSLEKFRVPGASEGFSRGSMKDMMMQDNGY